MLVAFLLSLPSSLTQAILHKRSCGHSILLLHFNTGMHNIVKLGYNDTREGTPKSPYLRSVTISDLGISNTICTPKRGKINFLHNGAFSTKHKECFVQLRKTRLPRALASIDVAFFTLASISSRFLMKPARVPCATPYFS